MLSILPLLYLASLMLAVTVVAEVPLAPPSSEIDLKWWNKLPRINATLLTYDTNGAACLPAKRDGSTHQLLDAEPFNGVAVWEESGAKAEVTYTNGVPHGPAYVILFDGRNRTMHAFRYDQGRRVFPTRTGLYLPYATVSGKKLADGGIKFLVKESKSTATTPEIKISP